MSSVTSFSLTRSISGTRRKKANRLRQNRERLENPLDSKPGVGSVVQSVSNMRSPSLRMFLIFAGSMELISYAIAGPTPVSPGGTGYNTQPVGSSAEASPASTSASQSNSNSSSGDDQSQEVGKDADGFPIIKGKPGAEREKIIQLKDGQKLPTSAVDPKFQGSLLNTSVDSITSIAPRKNKNATAAKVELQLQTTNPKTVAKDGADPQKKSEPVYTRSSEKPSPTPTPSPTAKASSGRTP